MASVNKVILVGNLGRDPELRYTPNGGQPVANFTLATYRDASPTRTASAKNAPSGIASWSGARRRSICAQYLAKGRQVYIEGQLQTREWEDKEGQKRRTTEVVAQTVQFLGEPRRRWRRAGRESYDGGGNEPPPAPVGGDDIPF